MEQNEFTSKTMVVDTDNYDGSNEDVATDNNLVLHHNTKMIRAVSKVATELDGVWYSFEFSETRELYDDSPVDAERVDLWNTVHSEVDKQVQETIESIRGLAVEQEVEQTNEYTQNNVLNIPPQYDF